MILHLQLHFSVCVFLFEKISCFFLEWKGNLLIFSFTTAYGFKSSIFYVSSSLLLTDIWFVFKLYRTNADNTSRRCCSELLELSNSSAASEP